MTKYFTKTMTYISGDADLWMQSIAATQEYSMLKYIPAAIVATHLTCSSSKSARMEYPHDSMKFNTLQRGNEDVIRTWIDGRKVHILSYD